MANIENEKLTKLYVALNTACWKKINERPIASPISNQILDSLEAVEKELDRELEIGTLTGIKAVRIFLKACEGHFTPEMPPISALQRKYPELLRSAILRLEQS